MAVVEREAEDLTDGRVEGGLHVVDLLPDDAEVQQLVGVRVVQLAPGATPLVREDRVRSRRVDGEFFPSLVVGSGNCAEIGRVGAISSDLGDFSHGLETDDTFDGEVGLVLKGSQEVIRAELGGRDQSVFNEELRPLVHLRVMVLQVLGISCKLVVRVGHQQHVTGLLNRHLLIGALHVTGGVWIVGSQVVH